MKLILTVGLPRSGKSTWAKSTGFPIVNPDSIRLALHGQKFYLPAEMIVWAIAHLMVEALSIAGNSTIILDATNTTSKRRGEWDVRYNVDLKVFDTSPDECIRRALEGGDKELVSVIKRMATQWDLPRPASWGKKDG